MTPDQLDQAAAQLAAALDRLDIQPLEVTEADLAADDLAFPPALKPPRKI